jgi:hypothetical protein
MGKVGRRRRHFQIKNNRKRREKLRRLRERYASSKNASERQAVTNRIKRIAPHLSVEEYLEA